MNYITHLNQWMELVAIDDRLTPNHISIYLALFQLWNKSRFPDQLTVCRNEVQGISKIGSSKTYYKCLHDLHDYGYIIYQPSYNPLRGSVIEINDLGDADILDEPEEDDENEPQKKLITSKKNLISRPATKVRPKKNRNSSSGKNDTGLSHVVTTLYINNKNIVNSKHRERRAHEKKINDDFSFQKKKHEKEERAAGERKKISSKPAAATSSHFPSGGGEESRRKKVVPRNFSKPTLDEIKDFFSQMTYPPEIIMDQQAREHEALKFYHHFESNGWMVGGKSPMRNWKAGCKSWIAKVPYFNRKPAPQRQERKNFHVNQQKNFAIPL